MKTREYKFEDIDERLPFNNLEKFIKKVKEKGLQSAGYCSNCFNKPATFGIGRQMSISYRFYCSTDCQEKNGNDLINML